MSARYVISMRSPVDERRGILFTCRDYGDALRLFSLVKPEHANDELVLTKYELEDVCTTPMHVKNV